jgi:NADH:ubiquinone oxidoreductase subunit 3 (subunit A)
MNANLLLSPPLAFLIALVLALGVYAFGSLIGAKVTVDGGKLEPYACGENFNADKFTFGYRRFFVAAIFFTIMHVAVLSIATVPGGPFAFRAFAYLLVIAASVAILYTEFD